MVENEDSSLEKLMIWGDQMIAAERETVDIAEMKRETERKEKRLVRVLY